MKNKEHGPTEEEILAEVKKISKNIFLIPATETCQREFKTDVVSGVYLLGEALNKKCLPLKKESLISAFKKIIPEQYLELNLKTLEFAKD